MRSGLSALGVIIAVAAVIAMTEIGQGSKATLQKGIASMGANTLMIFSGATATGGVNLGTGSAMTLTPQDAGEIARQCPAVSGVAPVVRARSQIVYGNRNWVPDQISGTTPSFLAVRDWQNMAQGEMFTDRDVRNGNKVCVIGNTVKRRTCFQDASPVGKEIRINNVSFRVVGVLSRKGANMMGMDQDNIVLAPWTTIKYRVSGTTLTNTNQSASAGSSSSSASDAVNTLSNLYPTATSLYPSRSSSQAANYPQPVRFTNVDQILVKAASDTQGQAGDQPDHRAPARAPPHPPRATRRLQHPRHGRNDEDVVLHHPVDEHLAAGRGDDLAGRRRRGHHEHHAGLRHRAHAGNRPPHGRRCPQLSHSPAVPRRGRRAVPRRRRDRDSLGTRRVDPRAVEDALADGSVAVRRSSPPWRSPSASASPLASIPPGRPRGWTRSKPCGTSEQTAALLVKNRTR